MLSRITDKQAVAVDTATQSTKATAIAVPQDPSMMVAGRLRIIFRPTDFAGTPEALKLDGKAYPIERKVAPFGGPSAPGGVQGSSMYFQVDVPPFAKDGEHQVEVRIANKWAPLTLNVLIPLHG